MTNFTKGLLSGLGAIFCFSIISIIGSFIYSGGATPLTLLSGRFFIAFILFAITLFIMGRDKLKIKKEDIITVILNSTILSIHLLFFWQGFKLLEQVSTTYALFYTYPFWVVILSILFLKEKFSKRRIGSLVLGTLGVLFAIKFLPTFSIDGINFVGVGIMLLAAIVWAVYALTGQALLKKYHPFTILFYNFGLSFLIFSLLQNPVITMKQLTLPIIGYLIIIGVVSSYFAYLFYYTAIKRIKASNTALLNLSLPFLSIILAFLILKQTVSAFQLFGIVLIISGGYLLYKEYYE